MFRIGFIAKLGLIAAVILAMSVTSANAQYYNPQCMQDRQQLDADLQALNEAQDAANDDQQALSSDQAALSACETEGGDCTAELAAVSADEHNIQIDQAAATQAQQDVDTDHQNIQMDCQD